MKTVILTIHIFLAFSLVSVILIQRSEGGGLGLGSGNLGGLMTTRGTANLLTRITAGLTALFFISTLGLAIYFKGGHAPKSILDKPVASMPATGTSSEATKPQEAAVPVPGSSSAATHESEAAKAVDVPTASQTKAKGLEQVEKSKSADQKTTKGNK
jgi:preprotein translocase subunit SecG